MNLYYLNNVGGTILSLNEDREEQDEGAKEKEKNKESEV
jgi:hypothetical protein